jgi:hypothetical protein
VALEACEVEAGTAVADMAVGPDQVLGAVAGAETGQRGPARVGQLAGERPGAEPVHDDQAAVLFLEPGQPLKVPEVRGPAEQQMKRWRGECLLQAAGKLVSE